MIKIKLNGDFTTTSAHDIAELLRETKAPQIGVAVAVNGAVVRRADHEVVLLQENDEIEIIRAVQGG